MNGGEKLISKSQMREENEIRISEISLPPDDGRDSALVYGNRPPEDCRLNDKDQTSNLSVPKESENSNKNSTQISKINQSKHHSPEICKGSYIDDISEISLSNTLQSVESPCPSTRPANIKFQNDNIPSPMKSQKLFSDSSMSSENMTRPSLDSKCGIDDSDLPIKSQLLNFVTLPSTSDIPLPEVMSDCIHPSSPSYERKNSISRFPLTKKISGDLTEYNEDHSLDKNVLNSNLASDKFSLDPNPCEMLEPHSKLFGDILSNCKNVSPLIEASSEDFSAFDVIEKKKIDDSRYSPSRIDSDEEGGECTSSKPKVLGKEQAKKRLMAFSLSKQPSNSVAKKQSKLITGNKIGKEKPPNPNKSAGVQEQFRATISAIEEEKKRMMQNMPNYFFVYKNNLSKVCDIVAPNTLNDKSNKDENAESDLLPKINLNKDDKDGSRSKYGYTSPSRSKDSRQRRSNSSRRSSSRSRKREKDDRKDNNELLGKMESILDWNSFAEAGLELNCFKSQKFRFEDSRSRKDRSRSPEEELNHKPIFNYLKKGFKSMVALKAKSSNPGVKATVSFQEKTVKYTRARPMITWAENPSYATDFFMPKQMLLENCDKSTISIIYDIMEQRLETQPEAKKPKQRLWYPQFNYLVDSEDFRIGDLDEEIINSSNIKRKLFVGHLENENIEEQSSKLKQNPECSERTKISDFLKGGDSKVERNGINEDSLLNFKPRQRRLSLVDDDYCSDEGSAKVPVKEMVLGNVKVQLDLGSKSVKVRSKWDSDYEGEETGEEAWNKIGNSKEMESAHSSCLAEISANTVKLVEVCTAEGVNNTEVTEEKVESKLEVNKQNDFPTSVEASVNADNLLEDRKGTLVSEYEEFMKIVSFGTEDSKISKSDEFLLEKVKVDPMDSYNIDKSTDKKVGMTDWDQESDREEKPISNKMPYMNEDSRDTFSLLLSGYNSNKQGKSKSPGRKKSGKAKSKNKAKRTNKTKKKYKEESSSESSSVTSESDSESDSDSDSDTNSSESENEKRKRKKKKLKKLKKKYSSLSDSESDSDSKNSKSKKGKTKKKRNKTKRSYSEDSSDSSEEKESTLLKQLDFKKQQIMKKIEEIDSINDKGYINKFEKIDRKDSSDSEELEKNTKKENRKKDGAKFVGKSNKLKDVDGKGKSKKKSDKLLKGEGNESASEKENESSKKGKKGKKNKKRSAKKKSTDSSSDDGNKGSRKGKVVKNGKKKKIGYISSSESGSDTYTSKSKKKAKKKNKKKKKIDVEKMLLETKQKICDWNDHLLSDGPDFKPKTLLTSITEEGAPWASEKLQWTRQPSNTVEGERELKKHKDLGDWEKSSSEESPPEARSRESSWDDDFPQNNMKFLSKETNLKECRKETTDRSFITDEKGKFLNEFNLENEHDSIFTESNLMNVGSDIFSLENNASIQLFPSLNKDAPNINTGEGDLKRNFHGISANFKQGQRKSTKDEIYSPGHTDSEFSDMEDKKRNQAKNQSRSKDMYDPLNSDSVSSADKIEISKIPLPLGTDDLQLANVKKDGEETDSLKAGEFIALPPADENTLSASSVSELPERKRMISVKLQQKFQCKVASVFQSDSEEEEPVEPVKRNKTIESEIKSKVADKENEKPERSESLSKNSSKAEDKKKTDENNGERSRDRSKERRSRDRYRDHCERYNSPRRRRSRTPDSKLHGRYSEGRRKKSEGSARVQDEDSRKEKESMQRNRRSKSGSVDEDKKTDEVPEADIVRPIPVLTGLDVRITDSHSWGRSHMLDPEEIAYSCDRFDLIDPSQMDFYRSQDGKSELLYNRYGSVRYDQDYGEGLDGSGESRYKREKRKSRSRSSSPKKRRRSLKNRSPRHRSSSPRRRGGSPFSPRRRSSPRRRYRSSRSPERKKSRSPRKRRHSPSRRSRSTSPRKHRSRVDSPRRSLSPRKSLSPRRHLVGGRNLIHVVGVLNDIDVDMSPMTKSASKYDSPMGFTRSLADSTISDSELNSAFYSRDYPGEFGASNYPEEITVNNLITLQNHDAIKQTDSPKRLTLDQRIEIELGVPPGQNDQYHMPPYQQFSDVHSNQYQKTYPCDETTGVSGNQNFYSNQTSDFNGQFFSSQQQPTNYGQFPEYSRHNQPGIQNSVLQVGNIMEVVPTIQTSQSALPLPHGKGHQIMQVGNVLQVVPSAKVSQIPLQGYNVTPATTSDNPKGPVTIPQNVIPNPEAIVNPLIKAIQLEREKRRKEKEKRRAEREERRKARQLKREAKLMSVNEKLKKSVQDEGLMLGQEVEEDELLEEIEHTSPPIPVEIVTDSSQCTLPPAGKGILITAGFVPKPASEKKEVKFADGICPGEGTSTSGGEERTSPPPKPKLPKEKRYKKKKTKVKKKVKVHIIKQIVQTDEEEEDDLSPPPPPPGDPPPVFFARFPFGSKAQYPVYQTQMTTLTTVQFPTQSYQ